MEIVYNSIKATVRTLSEGYFDLTHDAISELWGNRVTMRLVGLDLDPVTKQPKMSEEINLRLFGAVIKGTDSYNSVVFDFKEDFGEVGAIILDSRYENEFFLKSITLEMPDDTEIYFHCYTWICHSRLSFGQPRILFSNQAYLPNETPPALVGLRHKDLLSLRGDGKGQRVYGQRIYDYDLYNDISNPDDNPELRRPVLGGSKELPYPRRCRTGRPRTLSDPESESPDLAFDSQYVPRDERFSAAKKEMFVGAGFRSFSRHLVSAVELLIRDDRPFDSFDQLHRLFVNTFFPADSPGAPELIKQGSLKGTTLEFPSPGVYGCNRDAWKADLEFGRQRLAGKNPCVIELLMDFPPKSQLDPDIFGPPESTITAAHIEPMMEGHSVEEAMEKKRLFIVDYHDVYMPHIERINETRAKTYASRSFFYLNNDNCLLPVAIELTLPPRERGLKPNSRIFTPNPELEHDWLWCYAKTHVAVIDGGYHQLVSHWMRTHACIEPFIIATRRHLSTMHPLHVLLLPHFKDTMHINSLAKSSLINAGGKIESHYTGGRYCMELSSAGYKGWRLDNEAFPKDLLKRGLAVQDPSAKHGLRLVIEDYPFANDGLDLWAAIRQWVQEYLTLYYTEDKVVQEDVELQEWWAEVRDVGHADHADADWWVSMRKVEDLVEVATTIIWVASAHHAAINFGQYAYGGYMPNSPCMALLLIPEEGTLEYAEMEVDPEKYFLRMVPPQADTTRAMAVLELLAQHFSDEEYLGERKDWRWTSDTRAMSKLNSLRENLMKVELEIEARNANPKLHHRLGPAMLPYTLLIPSSGGEGLTFRGVPNSISM
ncbi:hypothetical protein KP509_04G084600 [Ceratopteris richardii]|uniref:Lipoxygenase n=2 Tax=Ceratopteris richardii TaxID=49495 RepID=A0A8T2V200_CERRI|nr:hypothetical protein KP509_04G084600 [Ceratopteris richardii]KAH7439963.1 hypothetical protein KP509_04G084600 [Ceratopteris richardii]KAH7439964.1 hypothetical protein KP509_04G084600 [Ceratopteris richardii]